MRTYKDRLRHTLLFEIILVAVAGPVMALISGKSAQDTWVLTLSLSLTAMVVNYLYNLGFDYVLKRLGRALHVRGVKLRALHAVLFEVVLLGFSLPLVMLLLDFSLLEALMLDVGFMIMVPVYAYGFNLLYDLLFPVVPAG